MEWIGTVVRLQIQTANLKVGERPRRYDPAPLRSLESLEATPEGVLGQIAPDAPILDVHHARHPRSKNRGGVNGVSIGFTAHYAAMRERFGEHLSDGIAGENILIATSRHWQEQDLAGSVILVGESPSPLTLGQIVVAAPCVEFSRYALRFPDDAPADASVTQALRFLDGGRRGFYAAVLGEPARVTLGTQVFLA
jgi:hypothetical protein